MQSIHAFMFRHGSKVAEHIVLLRLNRGEASNADRGGSGHNGWNRRLVMG
jgi:hypothetical protein